MELKNQYVPLIIMIIKIIFGGKKKQEQKFSKDETTPVGFLDKKEMNCVIDKSCSICAKNKTMQLATLYV